MARFWVHVDPDGYGKILDGDSIPVKLGTVELGEGRNPMYIKSAKLTIWACKDDVLEYIRRRFRKAPISDLGDRVEVTLPAIGSIPERVLAFVKLEAK